MAAGKDVSLFIPSTILCGMLLGVTSGGSKGAQGVHAPWGPNSFNFMQFLGKFGKFLCWRPPGKLAPPPRGNPGSATG